MCYDLQKANKINNLNMNSKQTKTFTFHISHFSLLTKYLINYFRLVNINSATLFCLALLFLGGCNCKNEKFVNNTNNIEIIKNIYSVNLKEQREIWIYIPDSDSSSRNVYCPVIYILDAEVHFKSIVEMITLFSEGNGKGALPKMAVIGITNTNRERDFTPSNDTNASVSSAIPLNNAEFKTSGGAEKFTLFIKNELIPFVDSTYHTLGSRILIGHSLGGLMVVNTLLNYTELFDGYIAIDPSIWWNNQQMTKQAKNIIRTNKFENISFFYANSNFTKELAKELAKTGEIPIAKNPYLRQLEFGKVFTKNTQTLSNFEWIHYERESHTSVPLIAIYDGLQIMTNSFKTNKLNCNSSKSSSVIVDQY